MNTAWNRFQNQQPSKTSKKMDALFATRDLSISILTVWIYAHDLRILDCAMCNRVSRTMLLNVMQDKAFCFQHCILDKSILQWAWMRFIGMETIRLPTLYKKWNFSKLRNYLEVRGSQLICFELQAFKQSRKGTVIRAGKTLEELSVPLSTTVFKSIAQLCPSLRCIRNLCTNAVTQLSMKELRAHCPALTEITYSGTWTNSALSGLWEGGYHNLLHVCIPSYPNFEEALEIMASNNPHLRSLKVFHDGRHRSKGVEQSNAVYSAIGENCHDIESLDLNISSTTDDGLASLGAGCPQLRVINLVFCTYVSSQGVIALARGCPMLRDVCLNNCYAVGDEGVIALAKHCPRLQYLGLFYTQASNESYQALYDHCPDLVTIQSSFGISDFPAVKAFIQNGVIKDRS